MWFQSAWFRRAQLHVPASKLVRMPQRVILEVRPPNPPMQVTPLRVPEIVAFLKVSSSPNVILIYSWRRN